MVGKLIEYEFLDERSNFKIWFGLWWSNPKVGSNRIKGELKRLSFNRQFSPKSLKMGQKCGQRVQNWPNKNQVASDLLRASSNSVLRAAEGIHQLCHPTYWGNPLVDNFSIRPAEGILQFCHRSYWKLKKKNGIRIECLNIGWKGKWKVESERWSSFAFLPIWPFSLELDFGWKLGRQFLVSALEPFSPQAFLGSSFSILC